jgi:hypothetical protein
MGVTQQQAEAVAKGVADDYERRRRQFRYDEHSGHPPPAIADTFGRAAFEAMYQLMGAVERDEQMVDARWTWSYVVAFRVTITLTLLVATNQRLWLVHHADGQPGQPWSVAYEAVHPIGKRLASSVRVQPGPQGVTITCSRKIAQWLQTLQAQRPDQPAAWLVSATAGATGTLPPPGWHPDPAGRHQLRWWDGSGWSEHVSDHGTQGTDPLG